MGSGEVAIVALSTMISLKVTFSDGLGGGCRQRWCVADGEPWFQRRRWVLQEYACN